MKHHLNMQHAFAFAFQWITKAGMGSTLLNLTFVEGEDTLLANSLVDTVPCSSVDGVER